MSMKLEAHYGGLVRLKTQLHWDGGPDNKPGRVCPLLGSDDFSEWRGDIRLVAGTDHTRPPKRGPTRKAYTVCALHLLLDGQPQWIWAALEDVEVIG
jgi:hypothetical protein